MPFLPRWAAPLSVFAHRKGHSPIPPAERMKAWQPTASNTLHPRCTKGDISLFQPTKKFPQAWRPTGTFSVISLFPLRRSRLGIRAEGGRQFGWLFHGGVSARAAGRFPLRQRRWERPFCLGPQPRTLPISTAQKVVFLCSSPQRSPRKSGSLWRLFYYLSFPLRQSRLKIRAEGSRQRGQLFHGGVSAWAVGRFLRWQRRRELPFLSRPAAPGPSHLCRVEGSVSLLPPAKKSPQIWQPMETFLLSLFPPCDNPVWE